MLRAQLSSRAERWQLGKSTAELPSFTGLHAISNQALHVLTIVLFLMWPAALSAFIVRMIRSNSPKVTSKRHAQTYDSRNYRY